jgi:hypothetical protein
MRTIRAASPVAAKKGLDGTCDQSWNGTSISPSWLMQPMKVGAVLLVQPLLGDGRRAHHRRGQARRRTAAAARIAHAVLMPIGVVCMARAETVGDIAVVLAALVFIFDQQRNRGAGGHALVHAGQDLHRVRFLALRHMARGARLAAVEFGLDVGLGQRQSRRAAIDHTADGRTMGFAEGCTR